MSTYVMTNDELRQKREELVRHQLDRDYPGHGCSDEDIKVYVAMTHSDEALAAHARQWHAQKRAQEMAYAGKLAEDQEAKKAAAKVTKAHEHKLANARAEIATERERAEDAESRAKGLEAQIDGLLTGQRT